MAGPTWLPRGDSLPREQWRERHRGIVVLLLVHAVGLPAFALSRGIPWGEATFGGALIAALAALAAWPQLGMRLRSIVAAFGLVSASAVLTHVSGGYIEAHFHFFVMLGVVFLYEDWRPYVLAVSYVALHHGILGSLLPGAVFNHPEAVARPWLWAGIHATFVLGLSAALIVTWNVAETARRREDDAHRETRALRSQLASHEKMAALGSLTAGLAHEVRTPLTVIGANIAIARIRLQKAVETGAVTADLSHSTEANLAEVESAVARMNDLVRQLRGFGRLNEAKRESADLAAVVREAVDLFVIAHRSAVVRFYAEDDGRPVAVNSLGVQQIVLNLLQNGVEASDLGSPVSVRTFNDGDRVCIAVEDSGCGLSSEARRRMFEPLFTTKEGGTGLGLSIVKRIADAHDAVISCRSNVGEGTRFVVSFPSLRESIPAHHAPERSAIAPAAA